jgi:alkaline phosphatase
MRRFAMGLAVGLLTACASTGARVEAGAMVATPASASSLVTVPTISRPGQETSEWWFRSGAASARAHGAGLEPAKNLILFVGDGMSLATVSAARIFEGQRAGGAGEEHRLSFEEFPYTALSRTYNTDSQTPDSAATMTAMMTGAKTRISMMSVGQKASLGDCVASKGAELVTLLELAEAAQLATGMVTTTRLTHATPGASFAHAASRDWENDSELSPAARAGGCSDIARQLIEFPVGNGLDVAMGGGRGDFLPQASVDPEDAAEHGKRGDGRDLIAEWQARHRDGAYVWNSAQLAALDPAGGGPLLGLFEYDHMHYENERGADTAGEPSLAEMTRAAILRLRGNPRGYVLVVEGGRIDHGHHAGNAFRALNETVAFAEAVRVARELAPENDTLILVTADHSHTLHTLGYPRRGNPILGKVVEANETTPALDALGLPYTTLGYASGPGYAGASDVQPAGPKRFPHRPTKSMPATGRPDLGKVDTTDPDFLQDAPVPLGSETHGSEDVGVWASGPGAASVHGSIEQHEVFHLMLQAQPALRALMCELGYCVQGVPATLPKLDVLEARSPPQAR